MLEFGYRCVIKGSEDYTVDPNTGEVTYSDLYDGVCDYFYGTTQEVNGVITNITPRLYLPFDVDVELSAGQRVQITPKRGKVINATILDVHYIDSGKLQGIKINLNEAKY